MRFTRLPAFILLTCGAASFAYAEEQRHHEVHEHGGGELDVAVEGQTLMIELSMPAMNIVGFEHPANNDEERAEIARAVGLLEDGMQLFAPSPAAGCSLLEAHVESALLENHDGHHDEHEHEGEHEDEHEHEGEHEHEEGPVHADFDISYEFKCESPAELDSLTVSLFEQFPGTEHLRTQVIMPNGQTGKELSAGDKVLELK